MRIFGGKKTRKKEKWRNEQREKAKPKIKKVIIGIISIVNLCFDAMR